MLTSSFVSAVGNRPFPMWDVSLQRGDSLRAFVERFDEWLSSQGNPRFFRITVSISTGAVLTQTTIEGTNELQIFVDALKIANVLADPK